MSNRKELAEMYKNIQSGKSIIKKLLPSLLNKKDNQAMMEYLDALAEYQKEQIKDTDNYDWVRKYNKDGIKGLNFFNKFGGLKGTLIRGAEARSRATKQEVKEINQFYKHLLSTKKERVESLKKSQTLINDYIKQSKKELALAKQMGMSDKDIKKLEDNIFKLRQDRTKDVKSRLRGYGISGKEKAIETLTKQSTYQKNSLRIAIKKGHDEDVINELKQKIKTTDTALAVAKARHYEKIAESPKYDMTFGNSPKIIKDAVTRVLADPKVAVELLGSAMRVGFMAAPLATAAVLYTGYSMFVAPKIWGSSSENGLGGRPVNSTATGIDIKTGAQKSTNVGDATKYNSSSRDPFVFARGNGYFSLQGAFSEKQKEKALLKGSLMKRPGVKEEDADKFIEIMARRHNLNSVNAYIQEENTGITQEVLLDARNPNRGHARGIMGIAEFNSDAYAKAHGISKQEAKDYAKTLVGAGEIFNWLNYPQQAAARGKTGDMAWVGAAIGYGVGHVKGKNGIRTYTGGEALGKAYDYKRYADQTTGNSEALADPHQIIHGVEITKDSLLTPTTFKRDELPDNPYTEVLKNMNKDGSLRTPPPYVEPAPIPPSIYPETPSNITKLNSKG